MYIYIFNVAYILLSNKSCKFIPSLYILIFFYIRFKMYVYISEFDFDFFLFCVCSITIKLFVHLYFFITWSDLYLLSSIFICFVCFYHNITSISLHIWFLHHYFYKPDFSKSICTPVFVHGYSLYSGSPVKLHNICICSSKSYKRNNFNKFKLIDWLTIVWDLTLWGWAPGAYQPSSSSRPLNPRATLHKGTPITIKINYLNTTMWSWRWMFSSTTVLWIFRGLGGE